MLALQLVSNYADFMIANCLYDGSRASSSLSGYKLAYYLCGDAGTYYDQGVTQLGRRRARSGHHGDHGICGVGEAATRSQRHRCAAGLHGLAAVCDLFREPSLEREPATKDQLVDRLELRFHAVGPVAAR